MDDIEQLEFLAVQNIVDAAELENRNYEIRHEAIDPFDQLSDEKFIEIYRLSKDLTKRVIEMVKPYMHSPSTNRGLSIDRKVLTALRFFASGSYQMDIGVNKFSSISQPSVSNCLKEVTTALNNPQVFDKIVKFPSNFEELHNVQLGFQNKYDIRQNIVGIIDCTHVAIFPPPVDNPMYPEHIYVNRKGYHSINTQLICDVNLRVLNVCAKYPGSVHDSHIWNQSAVKQLMMELHNNGHSSYMLLGDSGYALRPWMLTPFLNPNDGSPEAAFNDKFCKVRSTIERCNGVLKMRFRCLLKHRLLHYSPTKASQIIKSCVLLHNLCISENIPIIHDSTNNDVEIDFGVIQPPNNGIFSSHSSNAELIAGRNVRDHIVQTYFT